MQLYTWDSMTTLAGASAATLMIVQYIKLPLDRVKKIPTRLITLLIAFLILLMAHAFSAGLRISDVPLIAVNSFMVALSAMGAYESTFKAGDSAISQLAAVNTIQGTAPVAEAPAPEGADPGQSAQG